MSKQNTIKTPFTLSGKGLHTGKNITATFLPAKEDTGIVFVREDTAEKTAIPALASNVMATERGTVIGVNGHTVSTIEHAMAALFAHQVDNCIIQVTAEEFPILDGSARFIAAKINEVGIQEQDKDAHYFEITEEKTFSFDNGAYIQVAPLDGYHAEVKVDFASTVVKEQEAAISDLKAFDNELSRARTFVFVHEIEPLISHNLIKGGDLDNAIVIYEKQASQEYLNKLCTLLGKEPIEADNLGYINKRPLEYDNEIARHKLLDMIGDFSLLGRRIKGSIIGYKPGHTINTNIAKQLLSTI